MGQKDEETGPNSPCARVVTSDGCPAVVGTNNFCAVLGSAQFLLAPPSLSLPSSMTPVESWCGLTCFGSSLFSLMLSNTLSMTHETSCFYKHHVVLQSLE